MSMVNERQPFVLRSAVLYCFQCFLYKNQKGQGEIVATLLPSTIDANSISAGQLLCGGLFSADSLSNWCAAVALAHALQDNLTQKEQLLRVQLATSLGKPPVSLLQQCTNILSQPLPPHSFMEKDSDSSPEAEEDAGDKEVKVPGSEAEHEKEEEEEEDDEEGRCLI
ncbi:general vesicular transport factor p115-like [Oryzias latipes]